MPKNKEDDMADMPTDNELKDAAQAADEYEHAEPDTPAGACSNLGEMPDDLNADDDAEEVK